MQVHRDKKSEHNCAKAPFESPEADRAEALLQKKSEHSCAAAFPGSSEADRAEALRHEKQAEVTALTEGTVKAE